MQRGVWALLATCCPVAAAAAAAAGGRADALPPQVHGPYPEPPQMYEPGQTDHCQPTDCFDGRCAPGCCVDVALTPYTLNVSAWDSSAKRYASVGTVTAHYYSDQNYSARPDGKYATMEMGVYAHGPQMDRVAPAGASDVVPAVTAAATLTGKTFELSDIDRATWRGKLKLRWWSASPSTNVALKGGGALVAGGTETAPVVAAPDGPNGAASYSRGGVHAVTEDQCFKIFPGPAVAPEYQFAGYGVNTVDCHADSGFCWFSAWKFSGKTDDWDPDCLFWCVLDDPAAPTRCVAGGVAVDNDGRKICHRNDSYELGVGGGVHGFTVGKSTRGDDATVDLFLVYTGGVDLAGGVSWIRKVTVRVRRNGGADAEHTVTDSAEWGGELWRDSVADIRAQSSNRTMGPYGVGCDHAWVDESGDHVWVTTFRQPSDGIHMLEYDTGKLVYSVTGFATQTSPAPDGCYYGRCPDGYYANYSYAAGLSGRGALGAPGSVVTLATSQNYPTARVGGKGSVWYVDISTAWPRRQARGV